MEQKSEKLKKYSKKRDFSLTDEPKPKIKNGKEEYAFVVQYHQASRDHYDFRLQWNGTLLSWAVPKGPSYNPSDRRLAIKVEDHPIDYKDFEGTIPQGSYGGGTVMIWDEGTYTPIKEMDVGLERGLIEIELNGTRLKGVWNLVKFDEQEDNWFLIKGKDDFAKSTDGISRFTRSARSGLTSSQIGSPDNPFDKADVMLATLTNDVPQGKDWLFEVKYDGYRILAFVEKGRAKLTTRNNIDYTDKLSDIARTLCQTKVTAVFDGEVVWVDEDGRTNFQSLQKGIKTNQPLSYIVFDILAYQGKDVRNLPLNQRKQLLEKALPSTLSNVSVSNYVVGKGKESFSVAKKMGLEGIVGKRLDSPYVGKRSDFWVKIKCYMRQELVIGGHTVTDKEPQLSAVLLGYFDKGKFVYAGRAGTGFNEKSKVELSKQFTALEVKDCPFEVGFSASHSEKVHFVKPELVAEIQFAEWTDENVLRQASFKGLRTDKNAKEVVKETAKNL